ncbi:MAG: ABC transporter ATP-binding protein [Caldilineaceae bacterium]
MMSDKVIELIKATKIYGEGESAVQALKAVNLVVERGEFVAIMGPSGSGKSTMMNILGCLDHLTSGLYILDGKDVSRLDRDALAGVRNRKIGFVFQSFNLLPRLTALKNVMLPMKYNGYQYWPEAERRERATHILEAVGLGNRLNNPPNKLSGGQQQRVAIARALINNPAIIMADEPTGNLDSKSSEEIMGILQQLHQQEGATIVIVTHDPNIAGHAERIVTMRDGQIVDDQRRITKPQGALPLAA